ncbi:MAG TPA: pyridoxal phosphate-dependent aminotransferase [Burkholderiaceae bacterium]|jgi:aspartate/methionine/tyrosine aminotransferase|nr:pyridoxal phosphate-dependent aminotransferase [Burkholderiaceae bacterium]
MRLARCLDHIEPFHVMTFAKAARELAASPACDPAHGGERMLYLNIGEPDFTAPPLVVAAAAEALHAGRTQYTASTGLPALRERIARWYGQRWGVDVPAHRILVTAGASAALQLVCTALFQPGDEVLMPDPCYPCNRHFVAATGAMARLVNATPAMRFQLDSAAVQSHWGPATRGVLLATPSNPTGTSIAPSELAGIVETVRAHDGVAIIDEIYQGLAYDPAFESCALRLGDDIVSINSFSKYFGMTGWRLGWVVLPEALVEPVERLAQNLYICPSALAQHAALACFEDASLAEFEARRAAFRARRDFIVPALEALGLPVPVVPDGAFYAWADCRRHADDSWEFCERLLQRAHVALTPGKDFGPGHATDYFRLSFAASLPELQETVRRLARELA